MLEVRLYFIRLPEDSRKDRRESRNRRRDDSLESKSSSIWMENGFSRIIRLSMLHADLKSMNGFKGKLVYQTSILSSGECSSSGALVLPTQLHLPLCSDSHHF